MRDFDHAVNVLAEMTGLSNIAREPEGGFELTFAGAIPVSFTKASATEMELSCIVTRLGDALEPAQLVALLTANFLGQGTAAGRLALDPADRRVVYCERLDVTALEAHTLEARVIGFVKHCLYWQKAGADLVLAAARTAEAADAPSDVPMIRA